MEKLIEIHNKFNNDLAFFCEHALKIKSKSGRLDPFIFNPTQIYIHKKLEEQRKKTGKVRAIIVKARQQGCSTYVAARYFHKATRNPGTNVFILSHQSKSTENLFKIVKRFFDTCPDELKPPTETKNRTEMVFKEIDSQYQIGTAGSSDVGRGNTIHLIHGSEMAFWEKSDGIITGVMEAVPSGVDAENTEIILESTGKGTNNAFYDMTQKALRGESEFQVIFSPWHWSDEYKLDIDASFSLGEEERELKKIYSLSDKQLMWRKMKLGVATSKWQFKQEYPISIDEAFQASSDSLIDPSKIDLAMKTELDMDRNLPLIMGVDPARDGKDRTVIVFRRGRKLLKYFKYNDMDQMKLAGIILNMVQKYDVEKCFIDVAHGNGTYDRLVEIGLSRVVTRVNFGEAAIDSKRFLNKRAEMWMSMRDWIYDEPCSLPEDNELKLDLLSVPDYGISSNGRIRLVAKEKIKKEFNKSPDIGDAFALTFAYPVASSFYNNNRFQLRNYKSDSLESIDSREQTQLIA